MKHKMMCNYCGKILDTEVEIKDGEDFKYQCSKCGIFILGSAGAKECYSCGGEMIELGKISDTETIGIICQECQKRIDKQMEEHKQIVKDGGIYFRCLKCKTRGVIKPNNKICQETRERLEVDISEPCGIEIDSCFNCEGDKK